MEVQPSGWLDGIDTPGNLGGVADVSPPGDMISQIMINWGEMGTEYNFGELLPGSIAARSSCRPIPTAIRTIGEPPIAGVQVDLLGRRRQRHRARRYTDANGEYEFTDLRPGDVQRSASISRRGTSTATRTSATAAARGVDSNLLGDIDVGSDEHRDQLRLLRGAAGRALGLRVTSTARRSSSNDAARRRRKSPRSATATRTPDDTPLAGVVLELRDGTDGRSDPRRRCACRARTPALGDRSDSRRDRCERLTTTSAACAAGTYAVVEVQPDGVIDNVDTPGTLGGFAANPVGICRRRRAVDSDAAVEQATHRPVPRRVRQRRDRADSACGYGQHSQENNFSEVRGTCRPAAVRRRRSRRAAAEAAGVRRRRPRRSCRRSVLPPLPPIITPPDIFGGSSSVRRLHVALERGERRLAAEHDAEREVRFQFTSAQIDVAGWQNVPLDAGRLDAGDARRQPGGRAPRGSVRHRRTRCRSPATSTATA